MKYLIIILLLCTSPLAFSQSLEEFTQAKDVLTKVTFKNDDTPSITSFTTTSSPTDGEFFTVGLLYSSTMKWRVEITSGEYPANKKKYLLIQVYDLKSQNSKNTKGDLIFRTEILHEGFTTYSVLTMNGTKLELSLIDPNKINSKKPAKSN